ncbi:hypothetical protein BH20BAC1_BH20BAC1_05500 [soil metagenome]
MLAGTVLFFSSCKKELRDDNSPSSDLLSSFQKQNKDKKTVPFKANFTATQVVIQSIATFTLTAANGDQIFMNVPGKMNSATSATLTATITGGTGRFADARGTLTGSVINGATSDAISLEGWISY